MRRRNIIPKRATATRRNPMITGASRPDHALELIDLVVEAAKSRELPAFLAAFAGRAAVMLEAKWGVLGEIRGNKVELHCNEGSRSHLAEYQNLLMENTTRKRAGLEVLAGKRRSTYLAFYPIYASDGELMGTLCLLRDVAEFSAPEERLREALFPAPSAVIQTNRARSTSPRVKAGPTWFPHRARKAPQKRKGAPSTF